MKYLMLVCVDPDYVPDENDGAPGIDEWFDEIKENHVVGSRTRPGSDATTVRVRDRQVLLTDGPYAETKDLMAGFDVIDCADLDEAVAIASKHPMAWHGVIELRPFWPFEGTGS
ncbi:YciI family protein [Actinoplanes sp. NPDC049802]|uniref:YciI family protein n=1 Tax=Actinoplanes sp. NPDC049802 TaxID=3154742 RepID=UPI0033C864A5